MSKIRIRVGLMFNWFRKSSPGTKRVRERESNSGSVVLDNAPQQVPSESLRSLLKIAIADTEQIAASIKVKAQSEAEAEASRIIAQARLEVQETKDKAEMAARKQTADILSAANRQAEITELEAKQKALEFLISVGEETEKEIGEEYQRVYAKLSSSLQNLMTEGQNIEMELRERTAKLMTRKGLELKEYKATLLSTSPVTVSLAETLAPAETGLKSDKASQKDKEKIKEKPVQPQEKVSLKKTAQPVQPQVKAPAEKVEERAGGEEGESTPLKLDGQALYAGEVELTVAPPVELKLVSMLYNYLQAVPELRILYTRGSWDQGTSITVALEKPMSLISVLLKTPGVDVTPQPMTPATLATGKSGSLLRGEGNIKRIKLTLREAKSS